MRQRHSVVFSRERSLDGGRIEIVTQQSVNIKQQSEISVTPFCNGHPVATAPGSDNAFGIEN